MEYHSAVPFDESNDSMHALTVPKQALPCVIRRREVSDAKDLKCDATAFSYA